MKRALWNVRIVSSWATPGAITLRPPDHPAMKCGSTSPVAMRRSASTNRRSSLTGVRRPLGEPEVDVRLRVAREMVLDAHRCRAPTGRRRPRRARRPRSGDAVRSPPAP